MASPMWTKNPVCFFSVMCKELPLFIVAFPVSILVLAVFVLGHSLDSASDPTPIPSEFWSLSGFSILLSIPLSIPIPPRQILKRETGNIASHLGIRPSALTHTFTHGSREPLVYVDRMKRSIDVTKRSQLVEHAQTRKLSIDIPFLNKTKRKHIVVVLLDMDPSIFIALAMIIGSEDNRMLASIYQKEEMPKGSFGSETGCISPNEWCKTEIMSLHKGRVHGMFAWSLPPMDTHNSKGILVYFGRVVSLRVGAEGPAQAGARLANATSTIWPVRHWPLVINNLGKYSRR
ncbi:hypothetical protein EVAR_53699_1 [Eumeta japonica]|uniref:Uncharacterized protein n=1 Tax=Eumeta variegata TaxID=151549 RepID=A0A4C1ZB19_EUMVA|nr:hypothetical protein EVAR_53699_1 [Eumeta japonica]